MQYSSKGPVQRRSRGEDISEALEKSNRNKLIARMKEMKNRIANPKNLPGKNFSEKQVRADK